MSNPRRFKPELSQPQTIDRQTPTMKTCQKCETFYEENLEVCLLYLCPLHAAAGELLEASKGLLNFVRSRFPEDFKPGGPGFTCPHHQKLDAAIKKAEK